MVFYLSNELCYGSYWKPSITIYIDGENELISQCHKYSEGLLNGENKMSLDTRLGTFSFFHCAFFLYESSLLFKRSL